MSRPFKIVDSVDQLPDPASMKRVYCDIESISGDDNRPGGKPYHGDRCVGVAITHDANPMAYYVPLRHSVNRNIFSPHHANVPVNKFVEWATAVFGDPQRRWVNHNIKFDAHFLAVDGVKIDCQLTDTLVSARVVDMQRSRSGYGLKPLAEKWLGVPAVEKDAVRRELDSMGTKDYGMVDACILGEYACADVHMNRELDYEIERRRYPDDGQVWALEDAMTRTLFRVERRGVLVDVQRVEVARETCMMRMAEIESRVNDLGFKVSMSAPKSVLNFVTNMKGLPVVAYTKDGNPSMGGDAIREYLELDMVREDPLMTEFFTLLDEYRDRAQFLGLYAEGWMDWIVDGVIHPMYNQTVATGRMSCESPNIQQLSGEAKALIIPRPGCSFIRRDYSQIEYRVIAALSRDQRVIEAYRNDPTTDFHDFVAKLCGIPRKPAKNVNFGIAFGMGEEGLIRQLSRLLGGETAQSRAHAIYEEYNRMLPAVRGTAQEVKRVCRQRAAWKSGEYGWVRTYYGRRRALQYYKWGDGDPRLGQFDDTRKAFNTVVQGTAADIIKERAPVCDNDAWLRDRGIKLMAIVHDELLFEGPTESMTEEASRKIDRLMVDISINLGVPLRTDGGTSSVNWKECG
jgi:DNA polymerase I-like protein with 3'-5' exonuclease and polymerase domains